MACEFKMTRRVEFADTDMAGIMHFANFFRFMESAEHAFYRSLGFSVDMEKSLGCGWPRVAASCEYKRPLRFEDEVEIHLLVRELRNRSIGFEFVFRKTDGANRAEVARGRLTVVCVARDDTTGQMKAVSIPPAVRAKIQPAPPQLLEAEQPA
jgi:acyl-CoA thioester hydrolase